jgi:hypothetical protein
MGFQLFYPRLTCCGIANLRARNSGSASVKIRIREQRQRGTEGSDGGKSGAL